MCRPRRANSLVRMLPGVATPWPAAPPIPTEKSMLRMALEPLWGDLRGGRRKSTAAATEPAQRLVGRRDGRQPVPQLTPTDGVALVVIATGLWLAAR